MIGNYRFDFIIVTLTIEQSVYIEFAFHQKWALSFVLTNNHAQVTYYKEIKKVVSTTATYKGTRVHSDKLIVNIRGFLDTK